MEVINIHEAKTHLSRLVARAAEGEAFIIARSGKPLVKVVPLSSPEKPRGLARLGFMKDHPGVKIPDDFDEMGRDEIGRLFEGRD